MIIIGANSNIDTVDEKLTMLDEDGQINPSTISFTRFERSKIAFYKKIVKEGLALAIYVSDIKELILVCNIGVKYAVTMQDDAPIMQRIMENYLFDTKLLAIIDEEDEIEWAAVNEIDGVIFYDDMFED